MKHSLLCLLLVSLFLFSSTRSLFAQLHDWRGYIEQLAEEEDEGNGVLLENMFEELSMKEQNPMNLNAISREELEEFPLLTMNEAHAIADFLERNRPVYTVYELRNVGLLNYTTINRILPFFYVGEMHTSRQPFSLGKIVKDARHMVNVRFDKTLNKRAGFGHFPDSVLSKYPNRKYLGEDFYHSAKYSLNYRNKLQLGVVGEKDAGEPFWQSQYKKGYDHYGFHLLLRDVGALRTLVVGDYRLSFGQGLVLNNDFMLGKGFVATNVAKRTELPKRHFSTAESGFFRGVATAFRFNNVHTTLFYSHNNVDANLSPEGEITSLKTDGYHRTPLEYSKRNNTYEQVMGANINFRHNMFQVGISGLYHSYSKMFNPPLRYYNIDYWRGNESTNIGMDYSYRFARWSVHGEVARSQNGVVAQLHTMEYRPSSLATFSLLFRNYPSNYQAMYARAFADGTRVQNERGVYLGTTFHPLARVAVSLYGDVVRFPSPRYNIETPSSAIDFYMLSSYSFSQSNFLELRYKFKRKEKNAKYPDEKTTSVLPYQINKIRLRYQNTVKSGWYYRTTADFANYQLCYSAHEYGGMISQNIGYRGDKKIEGDLFVGYFNADTFNTRLYSYERNLMSTFYMPSFYDRGLRSAFSLRWNIHNKLSVSLKASQTNYFNRDRIGTGTEEIVGNRRTDLFSYIVWKF